MDSKGFVAALFDTSFSSFITTRFIRILYVLTILLLGVVGLASVFAFTAGVSEVLPGGVAFLLAVPLAALVFFFYVIVARIALEMVVVIFRIAENIQSLADRSKGVAGGPSGPAQPAG